MAYLCQCKYYKTFSGQNNNRYDFSEENTVKRYIALFIILILSANLLVGCGGNDSTDTDSFTYNDYVSTMATNWNPHTYETVSDNYPSEFLRVGFYSLVFNDELHKVEGKAPFEGYKVIPEMAADIPVDVTDRVRDEHPEFNIPASAVSGYAYTIALNPDAKWEDGTPINADTYVYSMKRLLSPELLNYRASDYYSGNFSIAGAEAYAKGENANFSDVGLYKSGEYEITLVLAKALGGFDLVYALTSNFIVYEELYEKCLTKEGNAWFSSYNTSVDTTMSYGPYKLVSYQKDKSMRFERNEEWYGYTDGQHEFIDPISGEKRDMYQTTAIDTQVIAEAATAKMMFLRGELMTYTLQAEDFDSYRNSAFAHETPSETVFFLILNGYADAIASREASAGFDTAKNDLQTMTLLPFRRAIALSYDKELFASTISPARSGALGLIGDSYLYDPENLLRYRDTDAAKRVLCDFYSVPTSEETDLDRAVASITGYDPETARDYYEAAFDEAIAAGYITDSNSDGVSDQTVIIEYCVSSDSDFMTKTVDYLNKKMAEVTAGTPFENRVSFVKSAPYGNDWVNKLKSGLSDTVLGGWSGSVLDPFSLTNLYVDPTYQYDANWFDSSSVSISLDVNVAPLGEAAVMRNVTMTLREWSDALNGQTVTIGGEDYNFGSGISDVATRLSILSAIEGSVLSTYNYIPMLQDASVTLLSKKAYYVIDDYNPVMGRGGIAYLGYNYSDSEWNAYVRENGGELKY